MKRNGNSCLILFIISLIVSDFGHTQDSGHQWTRTNPGGGGAFSTIGAGPGGIIIAGSDLSGAYRSLDGGQSWDVIGASRGVPVTHIAGIGFDPSDGNIIFLGTEKGIYRSEDAGDSFEKVYGAGYITDIEVSKSDSSVVYASYRTKYNSATCEIVRSDDNGKTWKYLRTNIPSGLLILKILVDPFNSNTLYIITGKSRFVCGSAEVYQSIDGGISWNRHAADAGSIMDLAIDQNNSDLLYLTTYSATCGNNWGWTNMSGKLYRSMDQGSTWTQLTHKTGIIFIDPDSAGIIRLLDPREVNSWRSDAGTWTSSDSGHTFIHTGFIENWDCGYKGIYDPVWSTHKSYGTSFNGLAQSLGTDLSDPKVILWTNSQFSFRSADNGATFQNTFTKEVKPGWWQSTGFDNIDMIDLVIHLVDPNIIYIGCFDIGLWRSFDHGESWQSCNHPDYTGNWKGYGGNTAGIAADPTRKNVVWATMSGNQKGQSPTCLLRSDDYGERSGWALSNSGLPVEEVMGLSVDPTSPGNNRTLFVTAQGDVYRSTDDGYNWAKVLENNGLHFTGVDFFNGNLVYAGGGAGLWRSTDRGDTWEKTGLPEMGGDISVGFWDWGWEGVFDIHPGMHQEGRVYVTSFGTNKGLWRSDNSGQDWEKLWTDNYMRRVAVSPLDPKIVYTTSSVAFTHGGYNENSNGVIVSYDGGANWNKVNDGMAWPFAICVELDAMGTVFTGSSGTGFQKSKVPEVTHIPRIKNDGMTDYKLDHNYPNPFNPGTNIQFSIPATEYVTLEIVNPLGENIITLVSQKLGKGTHSFLWQCNDKFDNRVSSGVYFYMIKAGKFKQTKKMIVFE